MLGPIPNPMAAATMAANAKEPDALPARECRRDLACTYTPQAFETIVTLMRETKDEWLRLACANAILDRGHGKPRWRAVADYRFPIAIKDKIGGAGIDSDRAVTVIALDHGVNEIVERRQCLTVAQPQAADGDEAGGIAKQFDPGIRTGMVNLETAVDFLFGGGADQTQSRS